MSCMFPHLYLLKCLSSLRILVVFTARLACKIEKEGNLSRLGKNFFGNILENGLQGFTF